MKEKYLKFIHLLTKEKQISIKRRKNLYVFSMILLFLIIVGKQAIVLVMLNSQRAESQFITHLSHQRIVCTEIVKAVYQHSSSHVSNEDNLSKINTWHQINQALLTGNKALGIPEPKISPTYINLYIEMSNYENKLLETFEMLKNNKNQEIFQQIMLFEKNYMAVLEKMLKIKGIDAGKNYGRITLIQMLGFSRFIG